VAFSLRLCRIAPIVPAIVEKPAEAERDMKPWVQVAGARFQQHDAMPPRRREPIGQNAPGAAGSHDDEVERLGIRHAFSSIDATSGDRCCNFETISRLKMEVCDVFHRRLGRRWMSAFGT
jgi:hypothetical protein